MKEVTIHSVRFYIFLAASLKFVEALLLICNADSNFQQGLIEIDFPFLFVFVKLCVLNIINMFVYLLQE